MSTPRLIYPLLEGYVLGDAISSHDGVSCYPAILAKTGEKYIVKVITVPASHTQLDALLLAGAFDNKHAAVRYFKVLAQDVMNQAEILRQLSNQEGFLAYSGGQIISSEDGNGFEVYLLGEYRRSLEQILSDNTMTRRQLAELGLDLCAALAACRRAGYLYVDLKPGNIFYTEEQGYRIGDVGFASLSALQFTPLENKYRSSYTPPEMSDDMAVINTTADVYALGLILYSACNGGVLPFEGTAPEQGLQPPMYADYEIAEIILKACSPDPADRWQDPNQLAQALIGYLQRNAFADAPLLPEPIAEVEDNCEEEPFLPELSEEELSQELANPPEEALIMEATPDFEWESALAEEDASDVSAQVDLPVAQEEQAQPPEEAIPPQPDDAQEVPPSACEEKAVQDTAPACNDTPLRPFPWRRMLMAMLAVILVAFGFAVKAYHDNVYIQTIDSLAIEHTNDTATVKIDASIDEHLLHVVCTDSYGNSQTQPVTAGIAIFTGLHPQTRYTVRVEIHGFHKLTGSISDSFTTPAQTQILAFSASVGPIDASVLLALTASGPEVNVWTVTYYADGEEPKVANFRGNHTTLYDLTVGKTYTFCLSAEDSSLGGCTQASFTATNIILAQDLTITACCDGKLTAQWQPPAGVVVSNGWAIRCYNTTGYDQTFVTYEPQYTFTGIDHSVPCFIEVHAVGMYQNVSTSICAHPITLENISFSVSAELGLTLRWSWDGNAPDGGWVVQYTVDGVAQPPVTTEETACSLPALPGGVYQFTITAADGTTVFGGSGEYTLSEVGNFLGYGVDAAQLTVEFTLPTLILTAPAETVIEASTDSITVLYILRSADGTLLQTASEELLWDTLWAENVCTLSVPTVPAEPGHYVLSIYFSGGLAAQVEFTVETAQ